jgi:hypothetical protein
MSPRRLLPICWDALLFELALYRSLGRWIVRRLRLRELGLERRLRRGLGRDLGMIR